MALRKDLTYVKEFETAPQPPAIQSLKKSENKGLRRVMRPQFGDAFAVGRSGKAGRPLCATDEARGGVALTRSGFFADGACQQSDPTGPYGISR
jgi:hypothetical protein